MIKEEKKEETASQGSVRIEKPEQAQQTGQSSSNLPKVEEPDFMKYIKGVNMNFDDKAYLKSHFDEEE